MTTETKATEKIQTRLIYLKKAHRELDEKIILEERKRSDDDLHKLKLKKLHMKEEIAVLENELPYATLDEWWKKEEIFEQ
jgi:hypothetical protein|tara:strand:+ start:469 stop:708 length:240 start_codon:yes stop_codon:yes gene_type:complete